MCAIVFCALLAPEPAPAAPPSPGTVISPIDKPVITPERTQTPQISREKKPVPAVPRSTATVKVKAFEFKGNTTFSDEVLKSVIAEYEGKELSIPEIYFVADIVESYYRYHGYLLTSVYIPAQQISSGSIILEVIEGRLGEIRFEGSLDSYTPEFLTQQADRLQPGQIIDDQALETETLLLGDLPGLDARAVIASGKEYGTSDVIFISEEDRYSGIVSLNNYGRESIGEKRIEAGFLMANPIFQGDMLNLSGIASENSHMLYARADYDALVNTSGTRVGLSVSYFNYDVDTEEAGLPASLTLEGNGTSAIIRASHPIQRTTRNNTTIVVNGRRSITRESGSASVRPNNTINLLEVFLVWDHLYSDYAKTLIQGGLATNFKNRENLLDTDSQKARLSLDVRHYQPFMETWFFIGRVQGVYSPDPLVDVERFRIGGQGSVRAYPSAELAGDKGGVISLDLGKNFFVAKKIVLTPRLFADAGKGIP
jgi:hemolysin activation/secretion protein